MIIFNPDEWFEGETNHIQTFISSAFAGIPEPDNKNTRCNWDFKHVIENLNAYGKVYGYSPILVGSGYPETHCKPTATLDRT